MMKPQHRPPGSTPVLRNVVLHSQPHALVRPGAQVVPPTPKIQPIAFLPPAAAPDYQQGLMEGRKDGYAAGHAAAIQEEQAKLLAAMQDECRLAYEQARSEGYERGMQEAAAQVQEALAQAEAAAQDAVQSRLAQLEQLLQSALPQVQARLAEAEDDMVALCHDIVCRILGDSLVSSQGIQAMLRHHLTQLPARATVAVHLHPGDLALLGEDGSAALQGGQALQWIADDEMQPGGVLLRSPEGSLDARLEVQMQALQALLLRARADAAGEEASQV